METHLQDGSNSTFGFSSLYSLEKLIEWKLYWFMILFRSDSKSSLLAREINWMETILLRFCLQTFELFSLLAREINWMETCWQVTRRVVICPSLLAREINWMETTRSINVNTLYFDSLYSLEKLIEWKLYWENDLI